MKRLAAREPVVVVPVVAKPIPVQVPAVVVPVEIRDIQVAVRIAQKYARRRQDHHPLNTLGVESYLEASPPYRLAPSIFIKTLHPCSAASRNRPHSEV